MRRARSDPRDFGSTAEAAISFFQLSLGVSGAAKSSWNADTNESVGQLIRRRLHQSGRHQHCISRYNRGEVIEGKERINRPKLERWSRAPWFP
jgi:hypothetical protein